MSLKMCVLGDDVTCRCLYQIQNGQLQGAPNCNIPDRFLSDYVAYTVFHLARFLIMKG